jgi:FAD/FMN-containing dehydrogenase
MIKVSSWGQLDDHEHNVSYLSDRDNVALQLVNSPSRGIAYGMGRSYGDVCLNPNGHLWNTTGLDRFISFDENTGILKCESGVLLRDIQTLFIPRGWIVPVTPGTQLITIGGAVANDVHGKNHHVLGSFGDHVQKIKLFRTDGRIIECGPDLEPDWFAATIGGFGLTGVIVEIELRLRQVPSAWIDAENIPYDNLNEFFQLADDSEKDWEYTVSWIDCLSKQGRGIFTRGNSAQTNKKANQTKKKITIPFLPTFSLVNKLTLHPFNTAYFHKQKYQAGKLQIYYESFFYPLDKLLKWNRIYGSKGFYQYQSVIPHDVGADAVQEMLNQISRSGEGSFLAVLKTFGNRESIGMMSFPQPGVTLALDFPNKGKKTSKLLESLDAIVREAKGRIYLAKDARMPRDLFEAGYPSLPKFLQYRDPGISSALSRRLIGD